ncbi:MAG: TetR/AcrR family transcriptional regulator [Stackebrandtia sp.]
MASDEIPVTSVSHGRVDKRHAIIDAAIDVFIEDGYSNASVDTIAARAGVAKPTIYNHMGGKEKLFRIMMLEAVVRSRESALEAIDSLPASESELRDGLTALGQRIIHCQLSKRGWALKRLLLTEAVRFPDLYDEVHKLGFGQINNALAGQLALLANAGRLRLPDPVVAASQFIALISGEIPDLTAMGARPVDEAAVNGAIESGVDTFLKAFAAAA